MKTPESVRSRTSPKTAQEIAEFVEKENGAFGRTSQDTFGMIVRAAELAFAECEKTHEAIREEGRRQLAEELLPLFSSNRDTETHFVALSSIEILDELKAKVMKETAKAVQEGQETRCQAKDGPKGSDCAEVAEELSAVIPTSPANSPAADMLRRALSSAEDIPSEPPIPFTAPEQEWRKSACRNMAKRAETKEQLEELAGIFAEEAGKR